MRIFHAPEAHKYKALIEQLPARHASPQGEAGGSVDISENLRPK
jgi:hypothetical protein